MKKSTVLQRYGLRPLALMEKWGWLGADVYFAHGIWFDDRELRTLQETRTGVAHCPSSNMRLGSGIARIKEMRELGIRVGLGVDGSASNDSSDMLGEARNALLLQRVRYGSDALSARDVLSLATHGGADLLGIRRIPGPHRAREGRRPGPVRPVGLPVCRSPVGPGGGCRVLRLRSPGRVHDRERPHHRACRQAGRRRRAGRSGSGEPDRAAAAE